MTKFLYHYGEKGTKANLRVQKYTVYGGSMQESIVERRVPNYSITNEPIKYLYNYIHNSKKL